MGLHKTKTFFTLTAGRTGTAWLGDFLATNTGEEVVHEPLGIEDFGTKMPDIRLLRHFNTYGNDTYVQAFWTQKLDGIKRLPFYAETNHTLAKCGLIENLAESALAEDATVIVLRRDLVRQCVSHLVRHDFSNVTSIWQWYLHPDYPNRLVTPRPFLHLGQLGFAIWYCYELAARQTYYLKRYGDRLNFVTAELEQITTADGAQVFWDALGGQGACSLPPPKNQNTARAPDDLVDRVGSVFASVKFDVDSLVDKAVESGFSFEEGACALNPMMARKVAS